eukprot:scaffold129689_cov96-Phaeocystis_antarctica.AAC.1
MAAWWRSWHAIVSTLHLLWIYSLLTVSRAGRAATLTMAATILTAHCLLYGHTWWSSRARPAVDSSRCLAPQEEARPARAAR